ncbi:methyltransferase family protein [Stella humosa]|uniref:Methyltransferase family protein n=2 Tax=Stella humosa TaxID=94 RepID=A0A3N1MEX4_9PROT|nr:methyltransferase family protein [Stella humosa]
MGPSHVPIWRQMIGLVEEADLSDRSVLDFGCNQGGFLRTLHALRPFRFGLGVDIAVESLAAAQAMKGSLPLDFQPADRLAQHDGRFDIAFSHEVVYLVPDVAHHARQVLAALRPGGVYYAATACHTGNRLWPLWRRLIEERSRLEFPDRSLDDYAAAFHEAGFSVGMRSFGPGGFAPYKPHSDSDYYPTVEDRMYAMTDAKVLFRLVKAE